MKLFATIFTLALIGSPLWANGYSRSYAPAFAAPVCGVGGCGQAAVFAPSYAPQFAAPCQQQFSYQQQSFAAPIQSYGYSRTVVRGVGFSGGYGVAGIGVYGQGVGFNRGFGIGSRQVIRQRTVTRGGAFGY